MTEFDVVIPTFNRRELLLAAINSALQQTRRVRVVVVDNASTDGSAAAVTQRWPRTVEVRRFDDHVPYQANINRCVQFLESAAGLILHDDDLLDPEYAETALTAFEAHPKAGLVVAAARPIQSRGSRFRRARIWPAVRWFAHHSDLALQLPPGVFAEALVRNLRLCPYWPTVSYRRGVIAEAGGFPMDLKTLLDYETWIKISARTPIVLLSRIVCSYRFHGQMMTNQFAGPSAGAFEDDVKVMSERLDRTLGYGVDRSLRCAFESKGLYPVMLLGGKQRKAHYARYLQSSQFTYPELLKSQEDQFDAFWRMKGWGAFARLGWQMHRVLVRGRTALSR